MYGRNPDVRKLVSKDLEMSTFFLSNDHLLAEVFAGGLNLGN